MIQPEVFIDYVMKRYPLANTINRYEFKQRGIPLDRHQSQVIENFFYNWDYDTILSSNNLEWRPESQQQMPNRPDPMSENDILLATSLLIPGQSRQGDQRQAITGEQRQADDHRRSLNAMGITGINSYLKGGKRKSKRKTGKRKSRKFR
jgi:hypothetical protein